jgi:hypothetical protein
MRIHWALAILAVASAFADTVTLKNGQVIKGTFLSGTSRQIKVEVGDQIQTLEISDIANIDFTGGTVTASPSAPSRPDAKSGGSTLPAGTNLAIRLTEEIDSEDAGPGETFSATIDQAVNDASGHVVIPRGAEAMVKLVKAKAGGTAVTLSLVSVRVNERMVDINTQTIDKKSANRSGRSSGAVSSGAATTTVIGVLSGGGSAAAIGSGAETAAGAAGSLSTSGEKVKIPSDTRLTFVLESPLRI